MKNVLQSRIRYPNPFQPEGIEFDLLEPAVVTISLTDDKGDVLETPVKEHPYSAGAHTVGFSRTGNRSGPLYYRIVAITSDGPLTLTKKFTG